LGVVGQREIDLTDWL